ncbi:hypothetical protein K439DRAFT_1537856 [Ramaria rubella]|nr:hypothetical protein K439DRAFT_1537856 [Ramaria rubella]
MPVHYNPTQARESFDFIQASFVPKGQYTGDARLPDPPTRPQHRINFTLDGCPRVLTQGSAGCLTSGSALPDVKDPDQSDGESYLAKHCQASTRTGNHTSVHKELVVAHETGDFDAHGHIEEYEADEEDLIALLDQFVKDSVDTNVTDEDLTLGTCTKDPQYVFCPPEHFLLILCLFARHHALHSLLLEHHGKSHTTDNIYGDSVTDMYTHCEHNSL